MSYCAARLHAISGRPRSSLTRRPARSPPSLLTAGGPIWRTLWPLATESDA
ncbi:MAG: hypothetical protein V3T81_00495 [Thermoanaerobaculia bacterium]